MNLSKPIVTAHKHGGHILFKPSNVHALLILNEIKNQFKIPDLRHTGYFVAHKPSEMHFKITDLEKKSLRINIYKIIEDYNGQYAVDKDKVLTIQEYVERSGLVKAFNSYGLNIKLSDTLVNYLNKEVRRQRLENTNYPTTPTSTDLPLFERATVGTNLLCIKDYVTHEGKKIFHKDKRYMVVDTGDETETVVISTNPVSAGQVVQLTGNGAKHEWTAFDPAMEEWFDDSSLTQAPSKNVRELYPERVAVMQKKLDKLNLQLYGHVKEDVVCQALYRGVENCYLPRLGKTSSAIATVELIGSQKVAVLTTKNIRIFWEREFKRLGIKNYVMVNSLLDLDKPGKYYVMTYNWLRSQVDDTRKARKNYTNYLKPAFKATSKKVGNKVNVTQTPLYNLCPHCSKELERPMYTVDEFDRKILEWTNSKGYMCRNTDCIPTTDNRKAKGTAWHNSKIITHKPGTYIDVYLARHANCDGDAIKGRQCNECKATDGVYKPGTYRRLKKRFTATIADEIHNAKSIDTQTAEACYSLKSKRRIGLTGTPMSNSAMDTYWPFHWIFKGPTSMFPYSGQEGSKEYENKFCQHIYLEKPTGEIDEAGNEVIKTVRKRIPFLANPVQFWDFIGSKVVRRTYSDPLYQKSLIDAGQNLPTLEIKKLVCDMHPEQSKLMLSALQNFKNEFAQMVDDAEKNKRELNEALVISQMSALRTIATSPEKMNERLGSHVYDGPEGGGKIANIVHIVKTKMAKGEKVVILSDFLDMQKACEKELLEFKPIRFQTNWDDEQREEAFREFSDNKNKRVFIAGTRAVREGVDLSAANTVVCCDLLWAPAFQTQAWSRTMAPTKDVRTCEVYLVISRNSLDEHMFNVFYSKMTAAEQAFDKKVLARRAQSVDIRFFVERVLQDVQTLSLQVRDFDDDAVYVPSMNLEAFGDRF